MKAKTKTPSFGYPKEIKYYKVTLYKLTFDENHHANGLEKAGEKTFFKTQELTKFIKEQKYCSTYYSIYYVEQTFEEFLYERMCVGCEHARRCHEECENCEEFNNCIIAYEDGATWEEALAVND